MAANTDFIFTLGADISRFEKSITQVEAELKSVRDSLKNKTGQAIVQTNQYIQQLESSLVNLRKVGLDKLPGASGQGAAALFSLSQVARDLPFGFIAIQNNLPLVIDQFSTLAKSSNGLGGALKQVGAALIGPAGISFAFGAIISGITALVQKYGSLGEAFNQILGLTPKLTEAQKEYNKASADASKNIVAESAKVDILVKRLTDLSLPAKDRIAAYNELKKVAPDVVAGIRDENALTEISSRLIESNLQARKELLKFEVQEAGIKAALTKNEELLGAKKLELINLENREREQQFKLNDARKRREQGKATAESVAAEALALSSLKNSINTVTDEFSNLEFEQNKILSQLDPIVIGVTNINEATRKRTQGIKDEIQAEKEQIANNKQLIKDQDKLLEQKKELIDFAVPMAAPSGGTQFDNYLKRLKEQAQIQKKIKKEQLDLENQVVTKGFIQDTIQSFKDFKVKPIEEVINPDIIQKNKEYTDQLKKQFESVKNTIEQAISAPLNYIFDTLLEGGKLSWKEFGKVVLRTLANILSSIITTTLAIAAADAITNGGYSATVRLADKATGGAKGIGAKPSLGYTPRGLRKEANFGGINGGLGLSGQVVFVQRGSDLVGVLNRSNATINRVG